MKRLVSLACTGALLFSLAGCGSTAKDGTDYSNSTLTGQITELSGTTVTLQLGELTEQDLGTPPEQGSAPSGTDSAAGAPDGTPPSGSDSAAGAPDGTPPSGSDSAAGAPDGSAPGGMGGGMSQFTAGEETATLDLSGAAVKLESGPETTDGALSDLAVGDVLIIEVGDSNAVTSVTVKRVGGADGQPGGGFGGSGEVTQGTAANTIEEDSTVSGTTYTSSGDDENALRVVGATVTLDGVTVTKSGGATSNTEDGDFYGMNAGLLVTDGANVTIVGAAVDTAAQNGNGVFSYGEGTVVTISDSTINTTADNSGGIQTTGGGTTYANDLTITTSGNSSAAIRSDRGGGTVVVDGGSYATSGSGSPAVYSTADITVKNATLTATGSEAVVVEGKNSVAFENCSLTGNMTGTYQGDDTENIHNIMLYQSMSGDADVGTSSFSATGGTITAQAGDMFYVTNTHSVITLNNVSLTLANGVLLNVAGNSSSRGWGTAGANGGQVEFTAKSMTLTGDITVDTISTLSVTLSDGAVYTGAVNIVDNGAGGTAVDNNAVVTVDAGCTWTLTGNCIITSLTNNGTIDYNGYTITLADGTVLAG